MTLEQVKRVGLNLFLINQTPILEEYRNDKRAGENRLATPAPRAYFRLYFELRSAIKNAREREISEKSSVMVPEAGLEPVRHCWH